MVDSFYKQKVDDIEIEYSISPEVVYEDSSADAKNEILKNEVKLDMLLDQNQSKVDNLNKRIEALTIDADNLDYYVAASSGVLAGLLDVFVIGETKPEAGITDPGEFAKKQVESAVINMAKNAGCKSANFMECSEFLTEGVGDKGIDVATLLKNMVGQAQPVVAGAMDNNPVLTGLIQSLLTQFTGHVFNHDGNGTLFASQLNNDTFIGNNFESKIFNGVSYWFLKLIMDGAKSGKIKEAVGIPDSFISLAKEMSKLDAFKNMNLSDSELADFISQVSANMETMNDTGDAKVVLKAAEKVHVSSIATPVIINECIVRAFYFITRLARKIEEGEIRSFSDFKNIKISEVLPVNNATITRMMSISVGAMEAVDLAGAAIKGASAAVAGGGMPAFWEKFVLNINFAGVGRLAISCASEANMGYQRSELLTERIKVLNERLELMNSKVYYNQADMWIAAEEAGKAIDEAYAMMGKTGEKFAKMVEEVTANINKVKDYTPAVKEKNPELVKKMKDALKWGI